MGRSQDSPNCRRMGRRQESIVRPRGPKKYSAKAYFRLRGENVALGRRVAELEAQLQETDADRRVRANGRGSPEDARFTLLCASAPQTARAVLAKNLDYFAGVKISESGLRLQVQRTKNAKLPSGHPAGA